MNNADEHKFIEFCILIRIHEKWASSYRS